MIITLLLLLTATFSSAYDRKCPDSSQWQLHARAICSVERNYICLLYISIANSSQYEEFCAEEDTSEPGGKLVLRPLKDFAECDLHRYQPFVFTTDGSSDCLYQKSKCNEDGQVVFNNGTPVRDTLCRCDDKNGYIFVKQPKNSCYCIPSEEDCSCYKTNCLPGSNCNEHTLLNFTRCEQNETEVFTEFITVFLNQYDRHDNIWHQGGKLVLRPAYDFVECNQHRYQPFVFTTSGNSECVYQKSKCNEDGQVVFNNGTPVRDTFCRCDYKNGYTFVKQPKNSCYCIPSEEDCSCYKTNCLPGFSCNEHTLLNFTRCEKSETEVRFTECVTVFRNQYDHHDNIRHQGQIYRKAAVAGTLLGIGMICILCSIC